MVILEQVHLYHLALKVLKVFCSRCHCFIYCAMKSEKGGIILECQLKSKNTGNLIINFAGFPLIFFTACRESLKFWGCMTQFGG